MEEETWFLETSQKLVHSDVYAARSWLLTAKSIFPQSFRLQIEEYMLELNKRNSEECSKALNEIFREFPGEPLLWEEIEKLIQAIESSHDPLRKEIFESLPALTQQRMILASAENRVNMAQYCRLSIVLMKKFPETVSQYGLELVEKLVEAEKKNPEGTPVNHYRRLLVREVLPVMCLSGNLSVSHKHFYKWLQKATEFYVCYFTSESESNAESIWSDLEGLRSKIAHHCSWNEEGNASGLMTDRMTFVRDLFRLSRTDVDGVVNRKQIFYTSLALLFEAASVYMLRLCPSIYRDETKPDAGYILLPNIEQDSTGNENMESLPPQKANDLNAPFQVAKEAWTILHANDTFDKDFNHLLRRWKSDRWIWFQLFLCDLHLHSSDYHSALVRLRQSEQRFSSDTPRLEVKLRTYCHLAFICFSLGFRKESCSSVFDSILLLSTSDPSNTQNSPGSTKFCSPLAAPADSPSRLIMAQVLPVSLMPFWVRILIQNLHHVAKSSLSDLLLGHLLVLSQFDWPLWRPCCDEVLGKIAEKKNFNFGDLFQFVINVDVLEEIAYLKNNKSCHFILSSKQIFTGHVTRGANEKAEEEFWKAITANIQRSSESIDSLLETYLTAHKDSILLLVDSAEAE